MNSHLLPYPCNKPLARHIPGVKPLAGYLYSLYARICLPPLPTLSSLAPVRIVCISDTHNTTPDLPDGDLLIHAGDFTNQGTYAELQDQLDWLSRLPHANKVVIAGNHDCLLDPNFVDRSRSRIIDDKTIAASDFNKRNIIYLQDSSAIINFSGDRRLKIYGSPYTPEYGNWAFQYPIIRDVWSGRIPDDADIVVTHCPPALHCDAGKGGDGYLLRELRRCKPMLVVCGHAHDGYGQEFLLHDAVQAALDNVRLGAEGVFGVVQALFWMPFAVVKRYLGLNPNSTRIVNAAMAQGRQIQNHRTPAVIDV